MNYFCRLKPWILPFVVLGWLAVGPSALADEMQEKAYLTQIDNSLSALPPLIIAAQQAQSPHQRVQFHYTRYRDTHGAWRNGLLEDIDAIRAGLRQRLDKAAIEPRRVAPLNGDYVTKVKLP